MGNVVQQVLSARQTNAIAIAAGCPYASEHCFRQACCCRIIGLEDIRGVLGNLGAPGLAKAFVGADGSAKQSYIGFLFLGYFRRAPFYV